MWGQGEQEQKSQRDANRHPPGLPMPCRPRLAPRDPRSWRPGRSSARRQVSLPDPVGIGDGVEAKGGQNDVGDEQGKKHRRLHRPSKYLVDPLHGDGHPEDRERHHHREKDGASTTGTSKQLPQTWHQRGQQPAPKQPPTGSPAAEVLIFRPPHLSHPASLPTRGCSSRGLGLYYLMKAFLTPGLVR